MLAMSGACPFSAVRGRGGREIRNPTRSQAEADEVQQQNDAGEPGYEDRQAHRGIENNAPLPGLLGRIAVAAIAVGLTRHGQPATGKVAETFHLRRMSKRTAISKVWVEQPPRRIVPSDRRPGPATFSSGGLKP